MSFYRSDEWLSNGTLSSTAVVPWYWINSRWPSIRCRLDLSFQARRSCQSFQRPTCTGLHVFLTRSPREIHRSDADWGPPKCCHCGIRRLRLWTLCCWSRSSSREKRQNCRNGGSFLLCSRVWSQRVRGRREEIQVDSRFVMRVTESISIQWSMHTRLHRSDGQSILTVSPGVDMFTVDPATQKAVDLTVMVRPLSGTLQLAERMKRMLQHQSRL